MFQQRDQHGGHTADAGCPGKTHQPYKLARIKPWHHHIAATGNDRPRQQGDRATHMVHRTGIDPDIGFISPAGLGTQPCAIDDIAMRQGCPFGVASGAGGELDKTQIVGLRRRQRTRPSAQCKFAQFWQRHHADAGAQGASAIQQASAAGVTAGQHHRGRGQTTGMIALEIGPPGVPRGNNHSGQRTAEFQQRPFHAVARPDGDAVSRLGKIEQPTRDPLSLCQHLRIGHRGKAVTIGPRHSRTGGIAGCGGP